MGRRERALQQGSKDVDGAAAGPESSKPIKRSGSLSLGSNEVDLFTSDCLFVVSSFSGYDSECVQFYVEESGRWSSKLVIILDLVMIYIVFYCRRTFRMWH